MKKFMKILGIIVLVLGVIVFIILKNTILMSHPELKGEPEENKWYREFSVFDMIIYRAI